MQDTVYPKEKKEIILVDNGSKDQTVEQASKAGALVLKRPGLTISGLRNEGVRASSSDIVAFIDADIIVSSEWLANGVNLLASDPPAVCLGGYIDIPDYGTWIEKVWHMRIEGARKGRYVEWVSSMNMFVKKDAFNKTGGFNEDLVTGEDVDFCYRIKPYGKIRYDKNVRVVHTGEAKTLRHFFLKERWRGQSNLTGIKSHGIRMDEVSSIVLPVYYLAFVFLFIPLALFAPGFVFFSLVGVYLAIPLARAFLICRRLRAYNRLFALAVLWWLYYTARGFAVVAATNHRK